MTDFEMGPIINDAAKCTTSLFFSVIKVSLCAYECVRVCECLVFS